MLPINLLHSFYWSRMLDVISQNYLLSTTTCIIWSENEEFSINWQNINPPAAAIVNIRLHNLEASFPEDIVDFAAKREELLNDYVVLNPLVEKLTSSIEKSHCQNFITFQMDIPVFIEAIINASRYSIWRSVNNKFLFVYNKDELLDEHFQHRFFEDQSSILLIERSNTNPEIFELKTNKFVGLRTDNPKQIYSIDRFNASSNNFLHSNVLFPDKLENLEGREVIMAAFDYRPDIVLKYYPGAPSRDRAFAADDVNGDVEIDGTEARILKEFCVKRNCSVDVDTSDAYDWGVAYRNMTGEAALGMIARGKAEVGMSAMYTWYADYVALDMSMYIGRSGITCVVPAPKRLASWLLPIEPFQPALWGFVVACLCVEVLALLFIDHYSAIIKALNENSHSTTKNSWLHNFEYAFSTIMLLFVSQSNKGAMVGFTPIRVMLFACFLNDIVVTSIYGGGLSSILTVPSIGLAADSVERLYAFQLKWGADSEAWVAAIRDDESVIMQGLLRNFKIYTEEELKELAQTEEMGFTIERLPFGHFAVQEHLTSSVLEKMKIMIEDIYFQYTVAFTARMWPMLGRFNEMVFMWHSSGLDKFWEWRIVADYLDGNIQKMLMASLYANLDDIGPVKLGMSNFVGMLLLWSLGIIFAFLAFLGELLLTHLKRVKKVAANEEIEIREIH
uniref:Ionotropic receptor 41a n=1 Tax=Anastrepha ludens TaxID=28586 RepID=A0A9E8IIP8_9MUSC|nr:ionotropic receptor 41a [Anastrepha ludens]